MKTTMILIAMLCCLPMIASAQQDYTYNWSKTIDSSDTGVADRDTSAYSYVWNQNRSAFRKIFRAIHITGVDSTVADTVHVMWYHGVTEDGPWTLHDSTKVIPRVKTDTIVNMTNIISTDSLVTKGNFWRVRIVNAFTPKVGDLPYYLTQDFVLAHKIQVFWWGKY